MKLFDRLVRGSGHTPKRSFMADAAAHLSHRGLVAFGALCISSAMTVSADYFLSGDFTDKGWTHGFEMKQTSEGWAYTVKAEKSPSYFTFYNKKVSGFNESGAIRYGAGDTEPLVESGVPYSFIKNNSNCYKTNAGVYDIIISGETIRFTLNENTDPTPDPDPNPDPDPTPGDEYATPKTDTYVYFKDDSQNHDWIPYVWAWNDSGNVTSGQYPGEAMKKAGENLWLWEAPEGKVPTQIIISNDGGEKAGGDDLVYSNKATYLTDGTYSEGEGPNPDPDPDPDPDPTPGPTPDTANYVWFSNDYNWAQPTVWAWNADMNDLNCNINGTWPGDAMIKGEGNLWYWVVPDGRIPTMILFSDNGGNQTSDMQFRNKATYHPGGNIEGGEDPVIPSEGLGKVTGWSREGSCVIIETEGNTLMLTPYAKEVVKVFTLPVGMKTEERKSISVCATPDVDFEVDDTYPDYISVSVADGVTVKVAKENGILTFCDRNGNEKLSELKSLGNYTHTVSFKSMGDEGFFGGGYNGDKTNILDRPLTMNNTQKWGWEAGNTDPRCINIPFVVSTRNYGVYFDDHYRGASINPTSNGLTYSSNSATPIAYYYVGGDSMDDVVANYTLLTGRQELPPYWALGYITSRYGYRSESEAQGIIDGIRNAGIPLDGIVFDLYWEGADESGMGNLDWYTPNFPDAKSMMARWKENGIHTTLITEPFFTNRCSNYEEPKNKGYFADESVSNMSWLLSDRVGLLDASNPEALDWMWNFYKARTQEGVDGWWLDLGEPEQHDGDSNHKGGSVDQVHNEFGNLWVERVYRGLKEEFPEMRPFLMPRAGTSGMQRFSTFPWTGDINRSFGGLQAQIPSLVNMSMAGVSYIGSDVGGFAANNDYNNPELYLRWCQFAALSPMFRTHSATRPEPTDERYSGILNDVKRFINLRYRLLPYTYTLSYENSVEGKPMARPACAFDEEKGVVASSNDSYLWGRDIFVAPVVNQGQTSRSITFPEGEWLDLNRVTDLYDSHSTVNYPAPLTVLPYFLRRGAFLPMFTQADNFSSTKDLDYGDITVIHYIDASSGKSEGKMFEDDRTSPRSIAENAYTLTRFVGEGYGEQGYRISYIPEIGTDSSFMNENRTVRLRLFGCHIYGDIEMSIEGESAMARTASDNKLTKCYSRDDVDSNLGNAYYRDGETGEMYIKTTAPSTATVHLTVGDFSTGADMLDLASGLSLSYSDGYITYSVPEGYADAEIVYFTADGRMAGVMGNLEVDSHAHQSGVSLSEGFYIARLSAKGADGRKAEKNVKFIVK